MSEKNEQDLDAWMKSGEYLPLPMRDFHDAKDLFKAIHELVAVDKHNYAKTVDWTTGQCYVIDIFLWFMAKRGYTLQKSRASLPFRDLRGDVENAREVRTNHFAQLIGQSLLRSATPPNEQR